MPKKRRRQQSTPKMPENDQLKPALTAENFHEHPDTPADQLSSFVGNYIGGNREKDAGDKIEAIAKHPNLPTASISDLYNHKMGTAVGKENGDIKIDPDNADILANLLSHKNAAPSIAEDFLNSTHKTNSYETNALHSQAASHSGISQEFLKDLARKTIDSGTAHHTKSEGYKLPADFHESLLANRGHFEPEGVGRLNEEQQANNKRIKNIDQFIYGAYPNAVHTKESLNRATEFYNKHQPTDEHAFEKSRDDFVQNQPNLSSNNLESLLDNSKKSRYDYGYDSKIQNIFNHPNISPQLVAKEALKAPSEDEQGNHNPKRDTAISSEKLPEETRRKLIRDLKPEDINSWHGESGHIANQLLKNKNLPAEDVEAIFKHGKYDAMFHPNAPEKLVREYYEKGNKGADHVRTTLRKQDLPPDILQDIVSHNQNQGISIEALDHPNANLSVVEAGLKRKAKLVQDAASRHPLVARQQLVERITNGKLRGSDFLTGTPDKKIKSLEGLDDNNAKDVYAALNEKYKDSGKNNIEKLGENDNSFWSVKSHLATGEKVPEGIKQENIRAVADKFGSYSPDEERREYGSHDPVRETAIQLANSGDTYTQQKWLNHPGIMNELNLRSPKYNTEFLTQATQALQEKADKTARDQNGSYKIERMNNAAKDMIYNPNISDELFHRLAMRPDFVENERNILHPDQRGGNYYDKHMKSDFNTVFDSKWGGLPEEQKRAQFQALAGMETQGAHNAVVNSMAAPTDIWLNSFNKLDPKAKDKWLHNHNITDFGDQNLHDMALYGKLGNFGAEEHTPQIDALKSMDPESNEDKKRINQFLSTPEEATDNRARPEEIVKAIPPEFFKGPEGDQLINNALDKGVEQEGIDAALKKTAGMEKDQALSYLQSVANRPDTKGRPDNATGRWYAMLHSDTAGEGGEITELKRIAQDGRAVNGKLDFLMSLPGDENFTKYIKSKALALNLISPAAQAQSILKDPEVFQSALNKADAPEKRRMIRDMLIGAKNLEGPSLQAMATAADNATLNVHADGSYRSRHSRGQEDRIDQQAQANNLTSRFFEHTLKLDHGPLVMAHFLHNATGDDEKMSPRSGALTKDVRKQVVSSFIKSLETAPIDDTLKNKYLIAINKRFRDEGDGEMVPGSLIPNIAKRASKNNDVGTLLSLVESNYHNPSVVSQLAKLANDPSKLSDTNLHSMIPLISVPGTSIPACNNIVKAAQSRISLMSAKDPASEQANMMKIALVRNTMRAGNMKVTDQWLDKSLKYANDPYVGKEVQKILSGYLDPKDSRFDVRKIFSAIPADAFSANDLVSWGKPTSEMINDPSMLEQGADGWKLRYLSDGIGAASAETASLLANRVVDSKEMNEEYKKDFAKKILNSTNAPTESVVKVFRSLSPDNQVGVIYAQSHEKGVAPRIHELFPHILGAIDDHMKNAPNGIAPFSNEHNAHTFKYLDSLGELIREKNMPMASESIRAEYADAIEKIGEQGQKIFDGTMSRIEQDISSNYKSTVDNLRQASSKLGNLAHNLSSSGVPLHGEQSMAVLGMIKNSFTLSDALNSNLPIHERETDHTRAHARTAVGSWMSHAQVGQGEWKKVFDEVPMMKYAIGFRAELDSNLASSVNWDEFFTDPVSNEPGLDHPMDQMSQILTRLQPDAKSYARTICDCAMNVPEGKSFSAQHFGKMVESGMQQAPEHFDMKFLSAVADRIGYSGPWIGIQDASIQLGVGGTDWLHKVVLEGPKEFRKAVPDFWHKACQSPAIDQKTASHLLEVGNDHIRKNKGNTSEIKSVFKMIHGSMAMNPKAPEASLDKIFTDLQDNKEELENNYSASQFSTITDKLMENPGLSEKIFKKLHNVAAPHYEKVFQANKPFNSSYLNPKFGGDLLRSQPQSFPDNVPNFKTEDKDIITKCSHSIAKDRLSKALQHIPPEGIMWAQFKKIAPKMENWPEVKEVFMSKNNKPLMPEDITRAMESAKESEFHVTYSMWDGIQRHTESNPNLVMQLSLGEKMDKELTADAKTWGYYKKLLAPYNDCHPHPITPRIASWCRIDTTGGSKGWIVEEFQTDFESNIQSAIAQAKKEGYPPMKLDDGTTLTSDEQLKSVVKIASLIKDWHQASINGLMELAKKQGVENVYMHGEGIAATLRGFKSRENPVWMQELYSKYPKATGWEKVDYMDYPNKNPDLAERAKNAGRPTYCWRRKVT